MIDSTRLARARRRAGGKAIHAFFHGLSAAGRLHPASNPARHDVEVLRDIAYRDTGLAAHRLDIWRPTTPFEGPRPTVLYVHGGGFRILSKETHWMMALAFARKGYVVANIDYRLVPESPFPAAVEDTFAAWEWVLDHIAEYGGDPSRVVVAGESAGANLVTALTIATCFERPEPWAQDVFARGEVPIAALPACGILDVSHPERFENIPMHRIVRDRVGEVCGGYLRGSVPSLSRDLADPLVFLESDAEPVRPLPPFFAPVGTSDPLLDDGRRLKAALDARGVENEVPEYEGEHHAFHAFVWRENARKCWDDTYAFLERHAPLRA